MDITTLEKAIELNKKINALTEALDCLKYNPELIIEYDGGDDDREQKKIGMELNAAFIELMQSEIKKARDVAVKEFNEL